MVDCWDHKRHTLWLSILAGVGKTGSSAKMKIIEKVTLAGKAVAAIVPIAISCVALYFSYETRAMSRENLSIRVNYTNSYIFEGMGTDTPFFSKYDSPALIGTKWSFDVTNLSSTTVSVLELRLHLVDPIRGTKSLFTGMYGNFEDVEGEQVSLPLNLESGTTRRIFVDVRLPLHSRATEVAKLFGKNCNASDIGIFPYYLAEHAGVDIFGNTAEVYFNDGHTRDLSDCSNQIGGFSVEPKVKWGLDVEVSTARSNAFSDRGYW